MKPHLVSFVQCGLEALRTPDLRETIIGAFQANSPGGCLGTARENDYVRQARERRHLAGPVDLVPDEDAENGDSDVEGEPVHDKEVIDNRLVLRIRLPKRKDQAVDECDIESDSEELDDEEKKEII